MHAGEERRPDAAMAAGRLALQRQRRRVVQAAQDDEAILERRERLQRGRELEGGAGGRGRPSIHHGAVRDVQEAEARLRDPRYAHLKVIRLRHPREARSVLPRQTES